MNNNLTPEQIENGREFLKDLRDNQYKATGEMRSHVDYNSETVPDGEVARCCLCVAYDTAQRLGAGLPNDDGELPPPEICEVYGWEQENPFLAGAQAAVWNDGTNGRDMKTHAEIADLFEEEFPQLKP
jgi:hypothetical protein